MYARSALIAFLVCCSTSVDSALAQVDKPGEQNKEGSVHPIPKAAFEANPGDDELTRLLKERYRTAVDEVAALKAVVEMGVGGTSDLLNLFNEAESRAAHAALELCKTSEQRIKVLQRVVDSRKQTEAFFVERSKAGVDPANVLHRVRHDRLDAEIELAREKRRAAKDKK